MLKVLYTRVVINLLLILFLVAPSCGTPITIFSYTNSSCLVPAQDSVLITFTGECIPAWWFMNQSLRVDLDIDGILYCVWQGEQCQGQKKCTLLFYKDCIPSLLTEPSHIKITRDDQKILTSGASIIYPSFLIILGGIFLFNQ